MTQGFCPVWWGVVLIVSQDVGKALGGAAAAFLGLGARTASGKFLGAIASLLVGYLLDKAASPVGGMCRAPLRSVA